MNNKLLACVSHDTDNWKTPSQMYDLLVKKFDFIDCFEYCSSLDQYEKQYKNQKLFINPPYSHLRSEKFLNYFEELFENNNLIVLLVPSRTDTRWFEYLFYRACFIRFIKGRLHFNDSKFGAPFPSCVMFFNFTSIVSPLRFDILDYDKLLSTIDLWCTIDNDLNQYRV